MHTDCRACQAFRRCRAELLSHLSHLHTPYSYKSSEASKILLLPLTLAMCS